MNSQSQQEIDYLKSASRSVIRRAERRHREDRRFRLRLLCAPGAIIGLVGIVWYLVQPYPAEHWIIGLVSVIVLATSLCLPSAVD
jgi:hypothetical protein